jgi:hypothetical protein
MNNEKDILQALTYANEGIDLQMNSLNKQE